MRIAMDAVTGFCETVIKFWFPHKADKFLTSWATTNFSSRTQLHGPGIHYSFQRTICFTLPLVKELHWPTLVCCLSDWAYLWVPYRLYAGRLPPSVVSVLILGEWNSRTVLHYTRRSSIWKPIFHYCVDSCVRPAVDELLQMRLQTEMEYVCRAAVQFCSIASARTAHFVS
jgi:hypothetical protein